MKVSELTDEELDRVADSITTGELYEAIREAEGHMNVVFKTYTKIAVKDHLWREYHAVVDYRSRTDKRELLRALREIHSY